ncbi:MAG: hypothetical protein KGS47_17240 [Chloroflexi bacterium]|nr:hypothetical protein [Chloroflexota bacterium]
MNNPNTILFEVNGDLEIVGDEVDQAQVKGDLRVKVRPDGGVLVSGGGGLVRVPRAAALHVAMCRALRVSNLDGALHIARAKHDVTLRDVAEVRGERLDRGLDAERVRGALNVQAVGGGLRVREVDGSLNCRAVGGGAVVGAMRGAVHLENVGGNLTIEGEVGELHVGNVGGALGAADATLTGSFTLNVGGSASLKIAPRADAEIELRAGGSVDCMVTPDADAVFTLSDGSGRRKVRVGGGAGRVSIQCGGRAKVRGVEGEPLPSESGADAPRRGWFDRLIPPAPPIPSVPPAPPSGGPSGEERMMVLRMLADKKITVEQADKLLAALG